ncbi:murinoglobulin-1-like [Oratosquilla oratoria]|uniref:murinoglobulin-1-like n=1 Tax=Oratosquilla oratoria TaxID=337810 RepID=UPI003F76B21B
MRNLVIFLAALVAVVQGSYVITTPRRWTAGIPNTICLYHVNTVGRANEHLKVTLQSASSRENGTSSPLPIAEGQTSKCYEVTPPKDHSGQASTTNIILEGNVDGQSVSHERSLDLANERQRTFIQTDKYLYLPGQTVRFRVLTVEGSTARIDVDNYRSVHVDTPSGTRIQQWLDVDNARGLIHLQFRLNKEVEEGIYTIKTVTQNNITSSTTFKVEEFVLPRYEVTLTSNQNLLGGDTGGSFRVCARYTFGQPVKGNATLTFHRSDRFGHLQLDPYVKHKPISGCVDIEFTFEEVTGESTRNPYQVKATATVTEEGTGVEIKSTTLDESVHREVLDMKLTSKTTFVKPFLPLDVEVAITHLNGTPAALEPMEVCAERTCKTADTDANGIIRFDVPSNLFPFSEYGRDGVDVAAINYQGFHNGSRVMERSNAYFDFERYFSPSNSSLLLRVPRSDIGCNSEQQITLDLLFATADQSKANITVQVISRGQIRYQDTKEYQLKASPVPIDGPFSSENVLPEGVVVGSLKIPINVGEADSPVAKVLVWYSRDDGEVVSDLAKIDIGQCLANKVNMGWNAAKAEPGKPATLNLTAEPNSFCSFGVVDKSVELLSGDSNQLTREMVLRFFDTFSIDKETNPQSPDDEYCSRRLLDEESLRFPDYGRFGDNYETHLDDSSKVFDASGLFFFTDLTTETRRCYRVPLVLFSPGIFRETSGRGPSEDHVAARTYFPETWLWDLVVIPDSGQNLQDLTLPDTVTEWVGKTVCVHPQKGVGISDKSSITTFTPFFAELTLPPSVKRGEILPVKISVFNYLDQALPVKVILEGSSDFDIFGEEGEVVVANGERSACVPAREKVTHTVRIGPKVLGNVNLTVAAFVDDSLLQDCGSGDTISKRDVLVKPLKVEAEGFPREQSWSKFICADELENNVDSLKAWRAEAPAIAVEGSERAFVTAAGDLLVPSLENLDNLVRMPSGCGEQNMILFAPNIYVLQYLEASEQLTLKLVDRIKSNMELGYQRELKFRHKDGSYSAFGESDDSGSTWLTAFVVKSFAQARPYIFIDQDDLNLSTNWLKQQQGENGCFISVGKVFHKELKGGLSSNSSSEVPLTAFVLVALLEAGEHPQSPIIERAAQCILAQETMPIYTEAIVSYALALLEHPQREKVLLSLLSKATETSSSIFWKLPPSSGAAVAVETAGYALLALSTLNGLGKAVEGRKIVKAISSKRNGQGGFISTQDTVVALQALAKYSTIFKQNALNLTVTMETEGLSKSLNIDNENKLLQQFVMLPTIPTNINLHMTGQGCALLQAVLRYNVPLADPTDAFSLNVTTNPEFDLECLTKRITACAAFLLPNNKPNMGILEVNLVSGYIPIKEDLKEVVKNLKLFKKFEVDGNKIMFYIDEFPDDALCASFRVEREVLVEKAKPGTVSVYDYYQPEFVLDESYEFTKECKFPFFF